MEYSEKIINAFRSECTDLMNSLEEMILLFEKEPENIEHINEIFRLVHSLKSETALMGFTHFSTLAHKLEDLFQKIRSSELVINDGIIEITYKVYDQFKILFNRIINDKNDDIDTDEITNLLLTIIQAPQSINKEQQMSNVVEDLKLTNKEIAEFNKKNYKNIFSINITIFENVALKYARAYLIYNNLAIAGDIVKTSVDFQKDENDNNYRNFIIILVTNITEKDVYDLIDVSEVERISVTKITVNADEIKAEKKENIEELVANSIRVDIDKIENLMRSVGELIVNYNRSEKFYEVLNNDYQFTKSTKNNYMDIISQFKRVIDGLQDDVMKIRMVPIKTLFDKFPRLIRSIAKESNKKVSLSISGEDTEVDKTVIEEIREPLTHIIRNSIDHGFEKPEERKKKGKNPVGTLKITSFQSGNNIVIKITDDGRGIDLEKIKKTIIQKKLIESEKISTLSDSQVLEYIFKPGLTTKEGVSEISGRGVGMDIVRTNVRKLQGKINLITKKDRGTSVIISIPLQIAIVNSLIINCGNIYFAIPLYFIQETIRIFKDEIQVFDKFEVIRLRKKLLSIIKLTNILDLSQFDMGNNQEPTPDILAALRKKKKEKHFVVVINFGSKLIGLIVDKLISEQDIVIKPLTKYIDKIEGISGVTILGDGNIAYILDPVKLISYYLNKKMMDIQKLEDTAAIKI